MKTILFPQAIFPFRNPLDILWQGVKSFPKLRVCPRNHGKSRVLFSAISESIPSKILFSFPAVRSRFICASHSSSFHE